MLNFYKTIALFAFLWGCQTPPASPSKPSKQVVTVKFLVTTDVHGWLDFEHQGTHTQSLAQIYSKWVLEERYQRDKGLIFALDGGDMWTGPPESTLSQGKPLIEAFNFVGYSAAALGNHEFDFGLEKLRENVKDLHFPVLCANLERMDRQPVDFCKSSVMVERDGVRFGIVGLVSSSTPTISFPNHVEGLHFRKDYAQVVRKEGTELMNHGATFLIVLAHEELKDLKKIANDLLDLPIHLYLGGHNHKREMENIEGDPNTKSDDIILLTAGCYAQGYGRIELHWLDGKLQDHNEKLISLTEKDGPSDPNLALIAKMATAKVSSQLTEKLGFLDVSLEKGTNTNSPLGDFVLESWKMKFPDAEFIIGNMGGFRQSLAKGKVTVRDVMNVLPFENSLVKLQLSKSDIEKLKRNPRLILKDFSLDESKTSDFYTVITTDFIYLGGDDQQLKKMDPNPKWLQVNWREPVYDRLKKHSTQTIHP